jgi:hypothetical protein
MGDSMDGGRRSGEGRGTGHEQHDSGNGKPPHAATPCMIDCRAGDATLADEVLQRASAEANAALTGNAVQI